MDATVRSSRGRWAVFVSTLVMEPARAVTVVPLLRLEIRRRAFC